jgi:CBS-domain-containing membrane protein
MVEDAKEALRKYGETLDIRRESIQPLLLHGSEVPITRVRLIYEGGALKPKEVRELKAAIQEAERIVKGVEVFFQ